MPTAANTGTGKAGFKVSRSHSHTRPVAQGPHNTSRAPQASDCLASGCLDSVLKNSSDGINAQGVAAQKPARQRQESGSVAAPKEAITFSRASLLCCFSCSRRTKLCRTSHQSPAGDCPSFQVEEVCKGQHRARCSQESLPPRPSFCRRVGQPGRDAMMNGLSPSWLSPALPLSPTTPTSPALGRDNRDQQGAKSVRSFHREEAAKLPQGGGRPWRETQGVAGQPPEQSCPG